MHGENPELIPKFHSREGQLFHADGRTDRRTDDEANNSFFAMVRTGLRRNIVSHMATMRMP